MSKSTDERLDEIQEKLKEEEVTHQEILKKILRHEKHIDSHTTHLEEMCTAMKSMNDTLKDFAALSELADNIETISKFGKLFRLAIIWTASLIAAISLIWFSFTNGFKQ